MAGIPPYELELMVDKLVMAGDIDGLRQIERMLNHPLYTFEPRPDNPAMDDEQTSFVNARDQIIVCVGGNASGKTQAAAYHVAQFLLNWQKPPRRDTPFWIISDTYEQCCGVCWDEKLSNLIPHELVDWKRATWYRPNRNWPYSIPLLPRPEYPNRNWVIEFKSYEQGREKMQARSIGGFWFSEQFPWEIFLEVFRGCRDYTFPGGQVCEFTPIDPAKSVEVSEIYREWQRKNPKYRGYGFYRLNTDCNWAITEDWKRDFFGAVSDEMMDTRRKGAFAKYEGAIYQTLDSRIHFTAGLDISGCNVFRRAIDWGASVEHPFVCLWAARDGHGQWRIFDEYRSTAQVSALHHIHEIKSRHPWPPGDARYGSTYADPSRPDNISLFNEYGVSVMPANNSVYAGIESVRNALKVNEGTGEPGVIIDEVACPWLCKHMQTYRWLRSSGEGINPKVARPEPLKKDDDECDALRYLIFSEQTVTGAGPDSMLIDRKVRESIKAAQAEAAQYRRGEGGGMYPKQATSERKR